MIQLSGRRLSFLLPLVGAVGLLVLTGCSSNSKPRATPATESSSVRGQLTDQDVFDIDPEKEITEEDIQDAIKNLNRQDFELRPYSSIILVQSGATAPDSAMQNAMMKYYRVAIHTGLRPAKSRILRKTEQAAAVPQTNFMRSLRLVAAKGRQSKIVVYWGNLELGKFDEERKAIVWSRHNGGEVDGNMQYIRYLIRFAAVDVKTGEWVMYSPATTQGEFSKRTYKRTKNPDQEIEVLKQLAYKSAADDISIRFDKFKLFQ